MRMIATPSVATTLPSAAASPMPVSGRSRRVEVGDHSLKVFFLNSYMVESLHQFDGEGLRPPPALT
jgi:hypothetical protein